ncbi:unnamed protein product [Caenorhabditis bovis]|uniref:Uncharacterized protein n=1 Tax=Caenorhabditis bovis TaxID=2654633 RepID=A0A8S1EPE9_9PELO|nr:unnamed protein product [Caenorhabditis bovis]
MRAEHLFRFPEWVANEVVDFYNSMGISHLFEWQHDFLCKATTSSENLVFSAPTSGGKSLVAELLALQLCLTGKKVVFVFPYISIAREKLSQLQRCFRRVDIQVAGYIGPQAINPLEMRIAICTIEKSASLINRALSEEWIQDIGMIIVDELHMVCDSSRGSHLENMLAKILLWNKMNAEKKVRIIGMSATIPQIDLIGNCLVVPCFLKSNPVLVMCSSKKDAEKTSISIAMLLDKMRKARNEILGVLELRIERLRFLKGLMEKIGCKDRAMFSALALSVAFHHAGLTLEERDYIERGFREGTILVLVATSTLASGVNLPVERVIIKAQLRGPSPLNQMTYKQMVGRAGRMGFSEKGK